MCTQGFFFLLRFAVGAYVNPYARPLSFCFPGIGIHMLEYVALTYTIAFCVQRVRTRNSYWRALCSSFSALARGAGIA